MPNREEIKAELISLYIAKCGVNATQFQTNNFLLETIVDIIVENNKLKEQLLIIKNDIGED